MNTGVAEFIRREACLNCGSADLAVQASGRFDEGALARFIASDPWGENPAPYLKGLSWSLVQCPHCRLRFHQNILAPEWNEIRFARWMSGDAIKEFERRFGRADLFERGTYFCRHVIALHHLLKPRKASGNLKVLDFGSGNGEFLAVAGAFGFEAHGVDRSPGRRQVSQHVRVHETLAEAALHAPFDAVSLFEVLEHLDDPAVLLTALRDVLKDGGILIVETPDCTGISSMEQEKHYRAIHPLDHINLFEPPTLQALVEAVGFRRIKRPVVFTTASGIKAVKGLVRRALGNGDGVGTQMYFEKVRPG